MFHQRTMGWRGRSGATAVAVSRAAVAAFVAALVLAGSASGQCEPGILGSVDTPGEARGVAVSGTVAYVADVLSLQVIDVSDPGSPVILGSVETSGFASGVVVSGALAYVADNFSGLIQQLLI